MTTSTAMPAPAKRREYLAWALGGLWLLDAALQFQPYMFGADFPNEVIRPTGEGSPGWVSGPVDWAATLMVHGTGVVNAAFATAQLGIALMIFPRQLRRLGLAASVVWSLMVWWLGEGLGGLLAGAQQPLMGAPGAVVLYAIVALFVWPTTSDRLVWEDADEWPSDDRSATTAAMTAAESSIVGPVAARALWVAVWGLLAVEALLPANRSGSDLHDMVVGMGDGEPGWLQALDRGAGNFLGQHASPVVLGLAVVFAVVAVSPFLAGLRRPALVAGTVVVLAFWVAVQDFGGLFTGRATDPNSGAPLLLLIACFWPVTRAAVAPRRPGKADAPADQYSASER